MTNAFLGNLTEYSLRARWVFPVGLAPLRDGVVTVSDGRIVSLAPSDAASTVIDLGDLAILPGLINAHTHLEFSELTAPLGEAGNNMPAWIQRVIAYRGGRSAGDQARAIALGIQESLAGGATVIGEIATGAWNAPEGVLPSIIAFREAIGLSPERADAQLREVQAFVAHVTNALPGVSPHAPYTASPALCRALVELANARGIPLAMHLAETQEELELLRDASGPLHEFLAGMGFLPSGVIPTGSRPLDYLQFLGAAPRALVIHGNYLEADELEFLAARSDRMALVYCPRTHAFFGHEPYHGLGALKQRGVRVCLGTDSRASNPDLSIFNELHYVATSVHDLSGEELLQLVTANGAEALGLAETHGHLEVGRAADLCIVRVANRNVRDPFELLWEEDASVVATLIRGKVRHASPGFADVAT